jgi:Zn-dependent oligopeptidase
MPKLFAHRTISYNCATATGKLTTVINHDTENTILPLKLSRSSLRVCALAFCLTSSALAAPAAPQVWNFNLPAPELGQLCDASLSRAAQALAAVENSSTGATMDSVFLPYDQLWLDLQDIAHVDYLKSVHPNADIRDAAERCSEDYSNFITSVSLSQGLYQRIAAIPAQGLGKTDQHLLAVELRNFRLSGVDRDEATREQVRQLKKEITELGNRFNRGIREDARHIDVTRTQLAGLPQDYIDAHLPDEQGVIRITTDYPDYYPFMTYAENDELRRQLYVARYSLGSPGNAAILRQLLQRRYALARLLDYPNYAAMAMDGLMVENPQNAQSFLDRVGAAVREPSQQEMDRLLLSLRQGDPDANRVEVWQSLRLFAQVREQDYALNAQEVREYFDFDKVQGGIFQLTEDLFKVQIVPWQTDTWAAQVSAWEVREQGHVIGRFYLDSHPRPDKYKHAAHWTLVPGIAGRQVPVSGLAMNFPRGLMEHSQVETFLHEFGHLLHNMFSGTQTRMGLAGMSMERDFVEAPSQMLEEWVWDYNTLSRFASNAEGQTIPRELVEKMKAAREFSVATNTANQVFYANLALDYYNRNPADIDLLALLKTNQEKYAPYPYAEGSHFYNAFGHLVGYASNYYMYQWSQAIATDMFSRFESEGLRNTGVAGDYRNKVLAAAGSRPARDFTADFLGRPMSYQAYIDFLSQLGAPTD